LGIGDNVEFLGFRNDVPELMKQIDVFVMASDAEPWGRVVAEAFVGGAAVVSVNAGGPREMIEDGVSGLLVPPGNPPEMAAAIQKLLESPSRIRTMAAAGRAWVLRECDPANHARKIEAIYSRLTGE
jgi:glycosyltransferase involved in cell wall biosynthesis